MFTKLKLFREMQEIGLRKLSRMTGIRPERISYIERNLKQPTLKEMVTLSRALNFSPECIFEIVDD